MLFFLFLTLLFLSTVQISAETTTAAAAAVVVQQQKDKRTSNPL
jgi:hypothetical protein